MKIMCRFALLAAFSLCAIAQTTVAPAAKKPAAKPPAGVDQALRARVNQYYTLVKNHEYRKAEALIAEDTKDYYYEGAKQELSKFDVQSVEYSADFTHATVATVCTQILASPGFPGGEMPLRNATTWRIEDGNWMLYVDQSKILSPVLRPMPQTNPVTNPAVAGGKLPEDAAQTPVGKLSIDKETVQISAGASQQIRIDNGSVGGLSLELGYPLPGIEAKLDRTELGRGGTAILTLTAGKNPTPGVYSLRVMPTGEALNIKVQVK